MIKLLYIEDDEIDVLALRRTLSKFRDVKLSVCQRIADLSTLNLSEFDIVLSDVNLPDGDRNQIENLVEGLPLFWVSGNSSDDVYAKPLSSQDLENILTSVKVINLKYIQDLADGDAEYEREMIEMAISVLPDRFKAIQQAETVEDLKQAAHKAKSSFRVCGLKSSELEVLDSEDMEELPKEEISKLIDQIGEKTNVAIKELQRLLR